MTNLTVKNLAIKIQDLLEKIDCEIIKSSVSVLVVELRWVVRRVFFVLLEPLKFHALPMGYSLEYGLL